MRVAVGYEKAEEEALAAQRIDVPAEMLDPLNPILVTKTAPEDYLADIRQTLALPYLISTPVVLHGAINRPIEILGQSCRVGASIGIAVFPDHGEEPATLLRLADESMYGCKRAGKNAFRFADRPACAPS